jgi:hypothetical protein
MGYCSGTVTMDGDPVEGLTVVMKPEVGRSAMAVTDGNGYYDIEYTLGEKGTKIGPTLVSFEWPTGFEAPFPIPEKYSQAKSDIRIEITKGRNKHDFELEPEPESNSPGSKKKPQVIVD